MALKPKQYLMLTFGVVLFLALLVGVFFEYRRLVYLLDYHSFWTWSLIIIGVLVITSFGLLMRYIKPLVARMQLFMFCLITFGVFTPAFIHFTNRVFHDAGWNERKYEFYSLEAKGVGQVDRSLISDRTYPGGYYIIFVRQDKLDRIFTRKARFVNAQRGDIIEFRTRRGLWGFEYVIW